MLSKKRANVSFGTFLVLVHRQKRTSSIIHMWALTLNFFERTKFNLSKSVIIVIGEVER